MTKKTFSFPKIAFYGSRRVNLPEVEIELRDTAKGPELSVCGVVWNSKHTDIVMGGQCLDHMMEYSELSRNPLFRKLYKWWTLYHLNGLNAGTVKQENALKEANLIGKGYDKQCEYLKSIDLYEDNGYKYGSGWLYRPIPEDDLNEIKALLADT